MSDEPCLEYVYFIRAETGHIKIGVSTRPLDRLQALQTACPFKLEVIGLLQSGDAYTTEAALHRQFASLRTYGEWFLPDENMMKYIRLMDGLVLDGHHVVESVLPQRRKRRPFLLPPTLGQLTQ